MPESPLVTVLMSTFNDAAFLPEAVASVLTQGFADFEFMIIDDGSTDSTSEYLGRLADARVRVVRNDSNQGLTRSLKRGVELARGRYLARLDADDAALPGRLEEQVNFMELNPDVAILGSGCLVVNEDGRALAALRQPGSDLVIRWTSLLASPFLHPTVMLRRDVLQAHGLNYDEAFETAQDYDLWTRVLRRGKGANLPKPLIRYRIRAGVTRQKRQRQVDCTRLIAARTIRRELPECSLQPQQLRDLLDAVYVDKGSRGAGRLNVADLAKVECRLYSEFVAKHAGHPDLPLVRRWHFWELMRLLWRAGRPPGWGRALAFVFGREPLGAAWFGIDLLRCLRGRIWLLQHRKKFARPVMEHSRGSNLRD